MILTFKSFLQQQYVINSKNCYLLTVIFYALDALGLFAVQIRDLIKWIRYLCDRTQFLYFTQRVHFPLSADDLASHESFLPPRKLPRDKLARFHSHCRKCSMEIEVELPLGSLGFSLRFWSPSTRGIDVVQASMCSMRPRWLGQTWR